jgi:hypothetical protein
MLKASPGGRKVVRCGVADYLPNSAIALSLLDAVVERSEGRSEGVKHHVGCGERMAAPTEQRSLVSEYLLGQCAKDRSAEHGWWRDRESRPGRIECSLSASRTTEQGRPPLAEPDRGRCPVPLGVDVFAVVALEHR